MTQLMKVGRVATTINTDDNITLNMLTRVTYHNTTAVQFNNQEIILKNNGYYTQTTKTRMNQASNQFGLGFNVYQKDSVWYVDYKGKTLKFVDGMKLNR